MSAIAARRLALSNTGNSRRRGTLSYFFPSRSRPALLLRTPPHCLKKKGTFAFSHWSRSDRTHSFFIGLAPAPLSPPTMTQGLPSRLLSPIACRGRETSCLSDKQSL